MNGRPKVERSAGLVAVAGLAILWFGAGFHRQYPISEWLLVRVLGYWLLSAFWALGCLSTGLEIVRRVAPRQYRRSEVVFVAFPLGVLAFAILTFAVSVAGALGRAFFFAGPLAFIALGSPALRELVRGLRAFPPRSPRPGLLGLAALAFGAVGLVLVYAPILTPQNLQHDARWYHLPLAAQYVAEGSLPRFPEGWFLAAYPHLSSLLYAWALLCPVSIVHRLLLAAHLEFIIFLATVLAIPAVVRRLLPGLRLPAAWAGFFLFPGFLVYDATVSLGADHIAALWAPGGLLALLATLRTRSPRHGALLGALAAGAAFTKYSALSVAVPLLGAALVPALIPGAGRAQRTRSQLAATSAVVVFALCWAPHWVKNWVFYGDPLYPYLAAHFRPHPWNPETATYVRIFLRRAVLRPTPDLAGVLESVRAALTLGFEVNDYGFHGGIPMFGFLFPATFYALPFVRAGRRVGLTYALGVSAALVWYWTNHRDRYLQAILPWFVAGTVSVLALAFQRRGRPGKVFAGLLVASQLAFGAGGFLMPVHSMAAGNHPLLDLIALERASLEKRYAERFEPYAEWGFSDWTALGKLLPPRSRVLVHEDRLWIGLDAPVVVDEAGWQGGIRYSSVATPADVFDRLAPFGITHVITGTNHSDGGDHGISGNLAFWDFLLRNGKRVEKRGKLALWRMPVARPAAIPFGDVLVLSCNLSQPLGLYAFDDLLKRTPRVALRSFADATEELARRADYLVFEEDCEKGFDDRVLSGFEPMTVRGKVTYYRADR